MLNRLPVLVEPILLARRGFSTSGPLSLAQMPRLQAELANDKGEFFVELEFGMEGNGAYVKGRVQGEFGVVCQRCLNPMQVPVDHRFRLSIVTSEVESDHLLDAEEPLLATGEDMSLAEIIEDELILQLPMVNMHENESCRAVVAEPVAATAEVTQERKNPFAVLAKLKQTT